jgi:hypothetical protein
VNSETSIVGIAEESANGSSYASGIFRTRASASSGVHLFSWWSVPRCAAISFANPDSSYPFSANPMEKVFTGRGDSRCINATVSDESIPPERNAPSGTSLIIRYDGRSEQGGQLFEVLSLRAGPPVRLSPMIREVPVRPVAFRPVRGDLDDVAGEHLARVPEDGVRRRHVLELEIVLERGTVDLAGEGGAFEERLEPGGEKNKPRRAGHEERLDPQAVAHQEELSRSAVPQREGEHPMNREIACPPPLAAGGEDHLVSESPRNACPFFSSSRISR